MHSRHPRAIHRQRTRVMRFSTGLLSAPGSDAIAALCIGGTCRDRGTAAANCSSAALFRVRVIAP